MAMHSDMYSFLKFVRYQDVLLWDIKRYFATRVLSSFPVVRLGDYINEESAKYSISDPTKTYGILGVNNQTGIFDAYKESGSRIKQKYKKMQVGWLAYNPYRVNVGSIGICTNAHNHEYISPAYVVFSCKESLLPEFLFLLMKTQLFNKTIRDNTTGSVRQNLNFTVLSNLQIPLPSLSEQGRILRRYHDKIKKAESFEQDAHQIIGRNLDTHLLDVLKVSDTPCDTKSKSNYDFLHFYRLKSILRWDLYNEKATNYSELYKNVKLSNVILSKPQYGAGFSSKPFDGNIRYIRITDINEDGSLNDDKVSANGFSERYVLKENDFLIARSGNTVGKTFLYKMDGGKAIYAGYLIRFELDTTQVLPDYLLAYSKSSVYKDWIKGNMRVSAQPNINSQQYLESPIILPPMNVQKELVFYINKQKTLAKQLRQKAHQMRQSALKEFENAIF